MSREDYRSVSPSSSERRDYSGFRTVRRDQVEPSSIQGSYERPNSQEIVYEVNGS